MLTNSTIQSCSGFRLFLFRILAVLITALSIKGCASLTSPHFVQGSQNTVSFKGSDISIRLDESFIKVDSPSVKTIPLMSASYRSHRAQYDKLEFEGETLSGKKKGVRFEKLILNANYRWIPGHMGIDLPFEISGESFTFKYGKYLLEEGKLDNCIAKKRYFQKGLNQRQRVIMTYWEHISCTEDLYQGFLSRADYAIGHRERVVEHLTSSTELASNSGSADKSFGDYTYQHEHDLTLSRKGDLRAQQRIKRQYALLSKAFAKGNNRKHFDWYADLAKEGFPQAQYEFGRLLERGDQVDVGMDAVVHWYTAAADQNDLEALYNLGLLYESGRLIDQNLGEAEKRYRDGGHLGHTGCSSRIAHLLASGKLGEARNAEAYYWFKKAASGVSSMAKKDLEEFCSQTPSICKAE